MVYKLLDAYGLKGWQKYEFSFNIGIDNYHTKYILTCKTTWFFAMEQPDSSNLTGLELLISYPGKDLNVVIVVLIVVFFD